jgi:hypothetical protein
MNVRGLRAGGVMLGLLVCVVAGGCSSTQTRPMEATAYCGCGECNEYTRGRWLFLKLNVWNRYLTSGPRKGEAYTGRTASGQWLRTPNPGLFSIDSLTHPWRIPLRIALPWNILPRDGTIAADTDYYPFGTRMHVPGWGWGSVEDRGGAIKGPDRLDLYYRWHWQANGWGRQRVEVTIRRD